jgi:hypothetical protein
MELFSILLSIINICTLFFFAIVVIKLAKAVGISNEDENFVEFSKEHLICNYIYFAYLNGLRVRQKHWGDGEWIKMHENNMSVDSKGRLFDIQNFDFFEENESWEICPEDMVQYLKHGYLKHGII